MFFINPFIYAAGADFESIATVTVGSGGASSIEFTSIPGTYQHLQIRAMVTNPNGANGLYSFMDFNTTTTTYRQHSLSGDGSIVRATTGANRQIGPNYGGSNSSSIPIVYVIDILDYASTSKTTVARIFTGSDINGAGGDVNINSLLWTTTDAVTAVRLLAYSQGSPSTYGQHSTAALYGIKAP